MESMVLTRATFQPARSELKALAPVNIMSMVLTWATFHFERSELKALAALNMEPMVLTLATFHFEKSELKALALRNIQFMLLTLATFQPEMFWLKALAKLNMPYMVLTLATFHFEMSALNVCFIMNISYMLLTAAVFHSPIGPYVVAAVVGLVPRAATAVLMVVSVRAANWPMAGGASAVSTSSASVVGIGIGIGRKEERFDTICVPPNVRSTWCFVDSGWTLQSASVRPSSSCSPAKIGRCSSTGMSSSPWSFAVTPSIVSLNPIASVLVIVSPICVFAKMCLPPGPTCSVVSAWTLCSSSVRPHSKISPSHWPCIVALTSSIVSPDST
jgi:hypothetical protein